MKEFKGLDEILTPELMAVGNNEQNEEITKNSEQEFKFHNIAIKIGERLKNISSIELSQKDHEDILPILVSFAIIDGVDPSELGFIKKYITNHNLKVEDFIGDYIHGNEPKIEDLILRFIKDKKKNKINNYPKELYKRKYLVQLLTELAMADDDLCEEEVFYLNSLLDSFPDQSYIKYERKVIDMLEKSEDKSKKIKEQKENISQKAKAIEESISYAQIIQKAVMSPEHKLENMFDDQFILLKPRDGVSGDFYRSTEFDGKRIVVASDCTGHGIPGAFMSMLGISALNEIVTKDKITDPSEILNILRDRIKSAVKNNEKHGKNTSENNNGMDITIISIDKRNRLEMAGAYNPLYIIREGDRDFNETNLKKYKYHNTDGKQVLELKADRMPVGEYLKEDSFVTQKIRLKKGDQLYLFSDGYPDQYGGKGPKLGGEKLKTRNFRDSLIEISGLPMNEQKNILNKTFKDRKGDFEQTDDVLVMGMKV